MLLLGFGVVFIFPCRGRQLNINRRALSQAKLHATALLPNN